MKKFGRKFLGISALALSLLLSVPANAEELTNTEQPLEEIVVDVETPDDTEDVAMATNGWVKNADGEYNYYIDGVMVKGQILYINGNYYYFDGTGEMLDNSSIIKYSDGIYRTYRAKKGGALYSGEWCGRIYYLEGGASVGEGIYEVNNKLYHFSKDGSAYQNEAKDITIDGVLYYRNNTGVLTPLKDTGWVQKDDGWYYRQDGAYVTGKVVEISGKYYGFNGNGKMYVNASFYNGGYRYAGFDGALITGWYTNSDGTYYYDDTGKQQVSGKATIDGKDYYFGYGGILLTKGLYRTTFDSNDILNYEIIKEDGSLEIISTPGWHKVDDSWYYIDKEYDLADSEFLEIGGKKYYFGSDGIMVTDREISLYPKYYRAKADGSLYTNTWYNDSNSPENISYQQNATWMYYGADGLAVTGYQQIDGKNYLFNEYGVLLTNGVYTVNDIKYNVDSNGIAKVVSSDGWYKNDAGKWSYILDGVICRSGLYSIDGKIYYFNGNSLETDEGIYYISNKKYYVTEGGWTLSKPGWNRYKDNWYYIKDDGTVYSGLLTEGDKNYYFSPEMVCNKEVFYCTTNKTLYKVQGSTGVLTPITEDGTYFDGNYTYLVENGVLFQGWKQKNGSWYCYNPKLLVKTVEKVDDKYYAFDPTGKMYTNTWVHCNHSLYYATSSGALATDEFKVDGKVYYADFTGSVNVHESESTYGLDYTLYKEDGTKVQYTFKNGWNQYDGDWYYVLNGSLVTDKCMAINGKYYYFDYYGVMATDTKIEGSIFGKDGAALTGWVQWGGDWYYVSPATGKYVVGLCKIGKYEYYFADPVWAEFTEGQMCTTEASINGKKYTFNSNGTVKSIDDVVYNGWNYINNVPVYYKNGQPYEGWVGDFYVVRGERVYNQVIRDSNKYYYLQNDGKYAKSKWITTVDGEKCFAKSNGALARNEWVIISGNWFYFNEDLNPVTGIKKVEGKLYYFNENGKMIQEIKSMTNGWNKVSDKWFYVVNGEIVRNGLKYISGNWYFFKDGVMVTDKLAAGSTNWTLTKTSYFEKNGVKAEYAGWKKIDGNWYYFNANHRIETGWLEVGGKTYYLDPYMLTGYQCIEHYLCYFDANGVLQEKTLIKNGWFKHNGKWRYYYNDYYVSFVCACNEIIKDGDAFYYFDEDGYMVTNALVNYDGDLLYFGADGKLVKKAGTYKDADGRTVYVTGEGKAHIGHVYINGFISFMNALVKYYW